MSVKKKIKAIPTIKISTLEDKSIKEVWVLNATVPRGDIDLEVRSRTDNSKSLATIPPTWVPICLTDQVPKSMLIDSPEFRRIITAGHIKLLDSKCVAEVMADPEVAREVLAVRNKTSEHYQENVPAADVERNISGIVLELLARENDETSPITEAESREILNVREEELTIGDLEYLIKNSKHPKVCKWSADTLTEKNSEA
jgi:hypothetical protein